MSKNISIDAFYHDCSTTQEWNRLNTIESQPTIDFSVQTDAHSWKALAKKICLFALQVIFFPIGAYKLTFYIAQRLIMIPLYPLQSRFIQFLFPIVSRKELDSRREKMYDYFTEGGYVFRSVTFEKDGVQYGGILAGKKEQINNGQWAIQATGNLEPIEHSIDLFAPFYAERGLNLLMVNGPGAGLSKGQANPQTMGDAQELGISFLESAMKAKKVVIAGRSLGGAAVGQAILKHEFKDDVDYLVIRQMTFDRTSNICAKTVTGNFFRLGRIVKWIIKQAGLEMDLVAASRKLQETGIKEVVVQCTQSIVQNPIPKTEDFLTDGPIPARASLGYRLIKEKVTDQKEFVCMEKTHHMDSKTIYAADAYLRAFAQPPEEVEKKEPAKTEGIGAYLSALFWGTLQRSA